MNLKKLLKNNVNSVFFFLPTLENNYIELTTIKRIFFTKNNFIFLNFQGICVKVKRKYLLSCLISLKNTVFGVTYQQYFYLYQYNLLNIKIIQNFNFSKISMNLGTFKFNF